MVKCLNIGKNIGKSIYRSISRNNYGFLVYSHQRFASKCPTLTVYSLLEAFLVTRPETASPYLQFEQVYVN